MTKDYFIRQAKTSHGDKYDYSKVQLEYTKDKVIIICPIHGEFTQRASTHLQGSGCPKCANARYRQKMVCGVGINDYEGRDVTMFTVWRGMLFRCYEKNHNKSYEQCSVCSEWLSLSDFSKWYYQNYKEGWQLDKDILCDGAKIYSPDTCCFVPREINMCVVGRECKSITYVKGAWQASFNQKYIGRFRTEEDATMAYRRMKAQRIEDLTEKYKQELPSKVSSKLLEIANALRLAGIEKEIEV